MAVDDQVPVVGSVHPALSIAPDDRFGPEPGEPRQVAREFEGHHLYGHGSDLPEPIDDLGVVHDDDHPPGGLCDHLFAQQRAAQSLDQVEAGVHLVGPGDGQVERSECSQRTQRDAQPAAGVPCADRRGHAGHIGHLASCDASAQGLDKMGDGRAGPEAQTHAGAYPPGRVAPRHALQFIDGMSGQCIAGLGFVRVLPQTRKGPIYPFAGVLTSRPAREPFPFARNRTAIPRGSAPGRKSPSSLVHRLRTSSNRNTQRDHRRHEGHHP